MILPCDGCQLSSLQKLGGLLAYPLLSFFVAQSTACEVGSDNRDRIAQIIDVAER